jgi:acyl-CoA reductase-like NAD-dependent aldehyde dehydrogenase
MSDRRIIEARNPATGAVDYRFTQPSIEDLATTVRHMRAAQPAWRALSPERRAEILGDFAAAIRARRNALFAALSTDTGRRVLAAQEIDATVAMIDRWRTIAPPLLAPTDAPSRVFPAISIRGAGEPYPLVGAISPWNFPLLLAFIDAVPALLAGASVFIKPSEVTPRFVGPIKEAIATVPDLERVLVVEAGDGAVGAALVPLVDVVAFTGSVATGRKVAEACARAFIPAFLELGGKDPAIVLDGADLDRAATAILRASVVSTGQACQSIERVYVDAAIHDAFVDLIVAKARAVRLSHEPGGAIGPLIFARQADIIADHVADAVAKGARVQCGGAIESRDGGRWIAPTVMTNVNHGMRVMTEETFGPIIPIMKFATIDEAVRLANETIYGLSAAVFAGTEADALAVAERLDAGGISINDAGLTTMVFEAEKSGFKLSGMGPSRMGPTGLTRFLRRKAFYVNRGAAAPIEAFAEKD